MSSIVKTAALLMLIVCDVCVADDWWAVERAEISENETNTQQQRGKKKQTENKCENSFDCVVKLKR